MGAVVQMELFPSVDQSDIEVTRSLLNRYTRTLKELSYSVDQN